MSLDSLICQDLSPGFLSHMDKWNGSHNSPWSLQETSKVSEAYRFSLFLFFFNQRGFPSMNSITPIFKEQYNYDFYNHKRLNKFSMVEGQSSPILVGKKKAKLW